MKKGRVLYSAKCGNSHGHCVYFILVTAIKLKFVVL